MRALHSPQAVFSFRHVPTWLLLAFAAGCVNAVAFLACARFVTHVTGTITQLGIGTTTLELALDYGVILGCFISGAMMSAALLNGRALQSKRPLFALPLLGTMLILVAVGVAGMFGLFGAYGGGVEGPHDFALIAVLAFAMGLQNASVATSTGQVVRTTHMTGPATDLGINLTTALYARGEERRSALRHAGLRAGKIASFILGAGIGTALGATLKFVGFFVPAALVAIGLLLSFRPEAAAVAEAGLAGTPPRADASSPPRLSHEPRISGAQR